MHSHPHQNHHRRNMVDVAKSFVQEHNPFEKRATVYKTVYQTLDPTFTGSVAGYTTIGKESDDEAAAINESTSTANDEDATLPASITDPLATDLPTTLATKTTGEASSESSSVIPTSDSESSTESSGSSTAAKAGIAVGVLAAVLFLFVGIWFLFKKLRGREKEGHQHLRDNEKINGAFSDRQTSTRTAATAPRLSLRPVTQFIPNLEQRASKGAAAMLAGIGVGAGAVAGAAYSAHNVQAAPDSPLRSPGQSLLERPMTNDSNHADNPFGNHAERAATPVNERNAPAAMYAPSTASTTANSTPVSAQFPPPLNINGDQQRPAPASPPMMASTPTAPGSPESAVVSVAGMSAVMVAHGAAVPSNLTRKASMKEGPKPLDLTLPSRPAMASMPAGQASGQSQGAAAIAAAGGPNNSTVHRVQLDFAPTLEDELELKSGQLVRLLHEYDDGWALCIRLDRSQQGVVPRTCLSARPVKPRPQQGATRNGPPVSLSNAGNRGIGPQGRSNGPPGPNGQPRPMSPAVQPRPMPPAGHPGSRPQSPAGGPMSPYRPQSPAGSRPQSPAGRPQSPGPQSPGPRSRSPSSGTTRRNNPPGPGPSPMNPNSNSPPSQEQRIGRKPVPGQAY